MASSMEFEAPTVEEAVSKAAEACGLEVDALAYEVLDEGADGVLGIGRRSARISVTVAEADEVSEAGDEASELADEAGEAAKAAAEPGDGEVKAAKPKTRLTGPTPEKAAQAKAVAEALLEKLGVSGVVEMEDGETEISLVIRENEGSTELSELFAKARPPVVPSFQFLLNKIVNRFPEDRKHILVEVPSAVRKQPARKAAPKAEPSSASEEPRRERELDPTLDPSLVELARDLAERVTEVNRVVTIYATNAADRRVLHQTIATIDQVESVSEGEDKYRLMHIVPAALGGAGLAEERRRRRRRSRRRPGM